MGKQAEKRISLAKRVLETTDPVKLDAVEIALLGAPPIHFTKKEIAEMEAQADRIERGEEKTHSWADVKKRALRKSRG